MTAIYVRVSTAEQAKEGYSIDEQIERLTSYCHAMNWSPTKPYVDAGCSGSNTDRPELQTMIRDINAGLIKRVVVYKLDRLSRSQKDTLELIEDVFLSHDCDFVSLSENFDTGTPFGRAMIGILAVFAQLEREQIKERMNLGRTGRAKEGKYHGGAYAPIGYDYENGSLTINEYEAMQVREIFDLFLTGMPIRRIANTLEGKGYRHKYGDWIEQTIRKILGNPVYIGKVLFDGQEYQGNHEPIINSETFQKASRLIAKRTEAYHENRVQNQSSLLGGLLWCKRCGARYAVHTHKLNGSTYKYYSCYSRSKSHKRMIKDPACKNKHWKCQDLDNLILDEIRKLKLEPLKKTKPDADREHVLRDHITRLEAQKNRLLSLYSLGEFTVEEIQKQVIPINEQRAKLEAEIKALTAGKAQEAQELISDLESILSRSDPNELRMVITALVERIELDGEDVTIHWRF